MDPTVTNRGGMRASQLAEKAADAVGDGETSAVELAAVSLALSVASLAGSAAVLAEQAGPVATPQQLAAAEWLSARPWLVTGPVPLASVELSADSPVGTVAVVGKRRYVRAHDLPEPELDACWRRTTSNDRPDEWVTLDWLKRMGAVLLAPGPVPLASADLLSDDVIDEVVRQMNNRPNWDPSARQRGLYRQITDLVNARLRAQFPDETPLPEPAEPLNIVAFVAALSPAEISELVRKSGIHGPTVDLQPDYTAEVHHLFYALARAVHDSYSDPWSPVHAPFVRGVDELSDDEIAFLRDFATALATRLRVDGPLRSPVEAADVVTAERLANRATGGYDPAKLAPGSVVVAGGKTYACVHVDHEDRTKVPSRRWIAMPLPSYGMQWNWLHDSEIPTDGVLVVDGATLGGQA